MGDVPDITVFKERTPKSPGNGEAGKIALIGAFKTETTTPTLFTGIDDAQATFGDDTTFDGCAVLPYLFANGAESVLCVNVSTKSGGTWTKTLDSTALSTALAKIKGENWDLLFVAGPITDAFATLIDTYLEACFSMKCPAGYVGALTGGTDAANITTAGNAGDNCYGLLTQQLTVNGTQLSVLNSAAYYAGLIAGMKVGNTMTMKEVPGVTAISPEVSFETGGAGKSLVAAGITVLRCRDRGNSKYVVVNAEQPNGLDLYINRVRAYVIKALNLHDFLGDRNRNPTLDEIKHEVMRIKKHCVDDLDLLRDIKFEVIKKSAKVAEVHLKELLFDDLIIQINLYVTVNISEEA